MCKQWEMVLPDYIANTLNTWDKLALEQHLTTCTSCQSALKEWYLIANAVQLNAHHKASSLPPLNLQPQFNQQHFEQPSYVKQPTINQEEQNMSTQAIFNQEIHKRKHQSQGLSWTFAAAMILLIFIAGLLFWGQIDATQSPPELSSPKQSEPTANIYEIISADENLSLFTQAIESSPWAKDTLENRDDITIFVPTNAVLEPLFSNYEDIQDHLEELVFLHMMEGVWYQDALVGANGERIQSQWRQRTSYGNTITPELTGDNNLILNRYTQIIEADIVATNGVIHIIDNTIIPPEELLPINFAESTLYNELVEDGRFTVFLSLIDSHPDIGMILQDDSPVTVFVPVDTALQPLLDEIEDPHFLIDILYAHMVRGIWTTERFSTDNRTARTVWETDDSTYITSMRVAPNETGELVINDNAWIIGSSIYTSNGIINVIDTPLFELPD